MSTSYYVGVDLHKQSFTFHIMDSEGKKIDRGFHKTDRESVIKFTEKLSLNHHVVLEPVNLYLWFSNDIRPFVGSLHLAHPRKVRLIAESKVKNDKVDSRILADLLRVGYLPEAWIPPDHIATLRTLVRNRVKLSQDRTRIKNRINSILTRYGIFIEAKDPFSYKGRKQLKEKHLYPEIRYQINLYYNLIDDYNRLIAKQDKKLESESVHYPQYQYFMSIPGFGTFSSMAIIAEIGDIDRFKSVRSFARYTGLTPGSRDSDEKVHPGGITHEGSKTLRYVLNQASTRFSRQNNIAFNLYGRMLSDGSSKGQANTAVAHLLARIVYHLWKEKRPYYKIKRLSS